MNNPQDYNDFDYLDKLDNAYDYDDRNQEPIICDECSSIMKYYIDYNYGADADGNRGIQIEYWECPECG